MGRTLLRAHGVQVRRRGVRFLFALAIAGALLGLGCGEGRSKQGARTGAGSATVDREGGTKTMNSISLQFAEYRGDPGELSARVDRYLAGAKPVPLAADPIALVVPHAGYVYSGPVAAWAYQAIKERDYDTVVIVGPSHRASFQGISVMDADRFETPLGKIPLDTKLIGQLRAAHPDIVYRPEAHAQEHSVEIQLPFLQRSLKKFSLVMAVIGSWSPDAMEAFVGTLVQAGEKKKVLLVASSDLSHYHDYASAKKLDQTALDLILKLDNRGLLMAAQRGQCELCGLLPVHLAMSLALKTGHRDAKLLFAANSGDTAGPKDQVVGYAAVAFLPGQEKSDSGTEGVLSPDEHKRLLEIARQTIQEYVGRGTIPDIRETDPKLLEPKGAFVTINRQGDLRGCIGNFTSPLPLYKTVMNMAMAACSQDPRFQPMNPGELKDMKLEISVLSPMRRITDVNEIEVGRHGLYLVKGHNSGTLLPQVAAEYGWDRLTFLDQTCRKAGLPAGAWRDGAQIYVYEAEVFGEE